MSKYIYEYKNWPTFTWEEKVISALFGEVRMMQGRLIGQMNALGFSEKEEVTLTALSLDIVKSSEIEGEVLDFDVVRSSIARRLGIETGGLVPSSRQVEGVVDMMMDATQRFREPLTHERLFGWHAALFPHRLQWLSQNRCRIISFRRDASCFGCVGKRKDPL